MYTDILNIFQFDPALAYYAPRSHANQTRMAASVQWGLFTSLVALFGTLFYLWKSARALLFEPAWVHGRRRRNTMVILGFSLAYFLLIALCLPFVLFAYLNGYWLSRLVMQALLGFIFLGFVFLDDVIKARSAKILLLCFAVGQAMLHASFLWTGPYLP